MSDLKVCRICLARGIKMYSYNCYYLKQFYEEVMTKKVYDEDGLPHHFCYLCSAMLYKLHKFKEKCYTGEKVLMELLWSGSLTLSSISQSERHDKNLQSTLGMIRISKRVRTCIMKSRTLSKSPSTEEINKIEIPENVKSLNYDSDNSLDDKILANIKNEMLNEKPDSIPDENLNMPIEKPVEKAFSDSDDDRISSEDDDLNPVLINDVVKPLNKEETNNKIGIDDENININTDKANNVTENTTTTNHKERKLKHNNQSGKKSKKFEVLKSKKNYLDPKHWLKINLTEEEALEDFRARARDRKYLRAAFQCTLCYKGFSKEDILNRHNNLRHSESLGPIECRFCKMRFKLKCHLTRHIVQHYTKYKCLRCDLMCPLESTAVLHNDYHNGVVKKCVHCGEEYRHLSSYYTHLRTHRSEHVCTLCGASFVSKAGLHQHKRVKHVNTVVNPEEHEKTYCKRCDIKFETQKAYEEHAFHSANHAEGCEDEEPETPAPAKRKCKKKCLQRKPRKVTPCTICNRIFPSVSSYLKHRSAEHKGAPMPARHVCEICGMSLLANSVASHLNTHTREKMFTCATCRMQFNSKSSMTRHQLTHTGEKPFECSMCDKRFTQKSSVKLHYRTFHLKEPYPKRNRRKNADIQQENIADYRMNEDYDETQKVVGWR